MSDTATASRSAITDNAKYWKDKGFKIMVLNLPMTGEWVYKRFVVGLLSMVCGDAYNWLLGEKIKLMINIGADFPIDHNRNKGILKAKNEFLADYILQFDTDQTFTQDTLMKLLESLLAPAPDGSEVEIVSGMYFLKNAPFRAVLGRYTGWDGDMAKNEGFMKQHGLVCEGECGEPGHKLGTHQLVRYQSPHYWPDSKLFRADVIGVGCVLSRMSMWDKLEYPYFDYKPDPVKGPERNGAREISEDMYWCALMHRKGVKVWIDPRVQCGHIGIIESDVNLYRGHFSASVQHVNSLPDGDEVKKKFHEGILDLR